jgi:hypothetical protein
MQQADTPLLVNLANDLIPGMHWLARAVTAYRSAFGAGDGMIGFNGDSHEVNHSCHFLISRSLLERYGGWPTWYDHNYGDTELCQRAIADRCYGKAPWALLFHDHPYFGGADDAVYMPRAGPGSRATGRCLRNASGWAGRLWRKRYMPDSTPDTLEHISKVQVRIAEIQANLDERAALHDRSKLKEPEKSGFDVLTFKLANLIYGTEDYKVALEEGKPTIAHHYAHNTHHPEHYPNGIAGMSLLDVIEMLADWKAASERTKQGSIAASLVHNKERFGISDQLASILENTVKELGW